jgi:hypothetical protein
MSTWDDIQGDLTSIHNILDQRDAAAADVRAALAESQAANGSLNDANSVLRKQVADLTAELSPWKLLHTYDVTKDEGWQINTGSRPTVDSSVNTRGNVAFTPSGLVLTAQRTASGISSCDIISKFAPMPTNFAFEADIQFGGYIGPGMFPCPFWFKYVEGVGGELDGVEYMGGRANSTNTLDRAKKWKTTAISLPATSPLKQLDKELSTVLDKMDMMAKHTWRYEHPPGEIEIFIDGQSITGITRADFDATTKTPGLWDKNFELPDKHFYTRHTWQVGPPTVSGHYNAGGAVPGTWQKSTMTITRMLSFQMRG